MSCHDHKSFQWFLNPLNIPNKTKLRSENPQVTTNQLSKHSIRSLDHKTPHAREIYQKQPKIFRYSDCFRSFLTKFLRISLDLSKHRWDLSPAVPKTILQAKWALKQSKILAQPVLTYQQSDCQREIISSSDDRDRSWHRPNRYICTVDTVLASLIVIVWHKLQRSPNQAFYVNLSVEPQKEKNLNGPMNTIRLMFRALWLGLECGPEDRDHEDHLSLGNRVIFLS